jgi:hypothetical protein
MIKKLSTETTYSRVTKQHIIDVNGKEVRVYEHTSNDYRGDFDYDTNIDEQDITTLSDDEVEELEDNLLELIKE